MQVNRRLAIGIATAMLAGAVPGLAISASAATNPPWEPDPNALGTLTFYNASGQVVTSGSNLSHVFDYAAASTAGPAGGLKATLFFAQPTPNVNTLNWPTYQASLSTLYPNTSAPPPINAITNPVVSSTGATDADLANAIAIFTPQTAPGYVNVYQVRVVTNSSVPQYWASDIAVNPTAGTWTEVYPVQGTTAVATSTALAASPPGSAQQHANVTLTATVSAADSSHPAGSVEFFQDGFSLGTAPASTTTGIATLATTGLLPSAPAGTALTATFTPTSSASYDPSTSTALQYTVNPVATVPKLSGPHQVGGTEKCSEGVLDFGVTASYSWLVAGKAVATGAKLVVPASAYKKTLACTATVHDGSGPSSSATSAPVTVILGKPLTATKKPTLSGPHKVGKTETVSPGTWSQKKATFTYQWLLNGKVIKNATKSTLKLPKADKGKKISCRVTAHAAGFANGVATTAAVTVIS